MKNRRGFLRWAFSSAVAASMAFGAPAFADALIEPAAYEQNFAYAHPTLASDSQEPVAMQLGLAMDTSGSMSNEEYALQLRATAHALNSELVRSAIKYKGSVAIHVIDFGNSAAVRVPWVDIRADEINDYPFIDVGYGQNEFDTELRRSNAPDKLDALVQEILSLPRRESGSTNIWTALQLAEQTFPQSPWLPTEGRVLDVFGDGTPDNVSTTHVMRDRLAKIGITINGFAIVNEIPTLEQNFQNDVVTQEYTLGECFTRSAELIDDSWCIEAIPGRVWAMARSLQASGNDIGGMTAFYDDVTRAMKQKISVELAGLYGYQRILAELDQDPDMPVPLPVRDPS